MRIYTYSCAIPESVGCVFLIGAYVLLMKFCRLCLFSMVVVLLHAAGCEEATEKLTCESVVESTTGVPDYSLEAMFKCPEQIRTAEDIEFSTVPLYRSKEFFDELWLLAYSYIDETQLTPGDTENTVVAEYVDASGIAISYSSEELGNGSGIWNITRDIAITVPVGLAQWTRLAVHYEYLADDSITGYGSEKYNFAASWTGNINNGYPIDGSVSATSNSGYTKLGASDNRSWTSPGCTITSDVESQAEAVLGPMSRKGTYTLNGHSISIQTEELCSDPYINIVRVSLDNKCVGLARDYSLEFVGSCSDSF